MSVHVFGAGRRALELHVRDARAAGVRPGRAERDGRRGAARPAGSARCAGAVLSIRRSWTIVEVRRRGRRRRPRSALEVVEPVGQRRWCRRRARVRRARVDADVGPRVRVGGRALDRHADDARPRPVGRGRRERRRCRGGSRPGRSSSPSDRCCRTAAPRGMAEAAVLPATSVASARTSRAPSGDRRRCSPSTTTAPRSRCTGSAQALPFQYWYATVATPESASLAPPVNPTVPVSGVPGSVIVTPVGVGVVDAAVRDDRRRWCSG